MATSNSGTAEKQTVVAVFDDQASAQQAVQQLRRENFREDQIGITSRHGEHQRMDRTAGDEDASDSYAGEGTVAGVATGAGVGALWGIGVLAGMLPAIGPVIAGGTLAALLASTAAGAAAAGLAGTLIGLGIPRDEAEYYEEQVRGGRTIVTVRANGRYAEALAILRQFDGHEIPTRRHDPIDRPTTTEAIDRTHAHDVAANRSNMGSPAATPTHDGGHVVQAREEELHVRKEPKVGEVVVNKEVHTEHRTINVPVQKEEVVIERRPVKGETAATGEIGSDDELRIPVRDEEIHVEKQPVVKEEIVVGKRSTQHNEQVDADLKKEEIKVKKHGDPRVRDSE